MIKKISLFLFLIVLISSYVYSEPIITNPVNFTFGYGDGSCAGTSTSLIYCFGSWDVDCNEIFRFDASNDSLTELANDMSYGTCGGHDCSYSSTTDSIYCFGGLDTPAYVGQFFVSNETFVTLSVTYPDSIEFDIECETASDGNIYCISGYNSMNNTYLFNVSSQTFTRKSDMIVQLLSPVATAIVDDIIYSKGSTDDGSIPVIYNYNISDDTWYNSSVSGLMTSLVCPACTGRIGEQSGCAGIGGEVYCIGGIYGNNISIYDISENTITYDGNYPFDVGSGQGDGYYDVVEYDNILYSFGGANGGDHPEIFKYDFLIAEDGCSYSCILFDICQPDITGGYKDCIGVNETGVCNYTGDYSEFQGWCDYCIIGEEATSGECIDHLRFWDYTLTNNETCCALTGNESDCDVSDSYNTSCGYMKRYAGGDLSGVSIDIIIGILAVFFSFVAIIGIVLIHVYIIKPRLRGGYK